MQCISPITMRGQTGDGITVPCGKCSACRISKSREWSIRLLHELTYQEKAGFFTFTYDEEHLPKNGEISIDELQRLFKRIRKDHEVKYYACGEYGENYGRPHYHAIIFGLGPKDIIEIKKYWKKGMVKIGTVTYESCRYVCDYINKYVDGPMADQMYGKKQKPFKIMSKGIGFSFLANNLKQLAQREYITHKGIKLALPRYYHSYIKQNFTKKTGLMDRIKLIQRSKKLQKLGVTWLREAKQKQSNYDARLNIKNKGVL